MRLAILLMVHKNLEQVQMLISALHHPDSTLFIHADKKMSIWALRVSPNFIRYLVSDKSRSERI